MNNNRAGSRVLAASTAAILIGLLTACGNGAGEATVEDSAYNGEPVTIDFWHGFTGGGAVEAVPELIAKFNEEHETITVKETPTPWDDMSSKMPLAIKSGEGPDVAVLHGDDIATYAVQGQFIEADEIVNSLGYEEGDFPPGLLEAGSYNGSQYALPWSVTPLGIYANVNVLEKAGLSAEAVPTDNESYMEYLEALKDAGIQGQSLDPNMFTGMLMFKTMLWQFGGELFDEEATEATFNSDAGVKALSWMVDLVDKGYAPKELAGGLNPVIAGENAYYWTGVWNTTNPTLQEVDWVAAAVPQIGEEKAVWSSSTHWVFPKNKNQSPNETAAAAIFVQWMNDHSLDWAGLGELPALNSVREDPALLEQYPRLEPFIDELEYARYEFSAPGTVAAEAPILTALGEALRSEKSPQEALDAAAAESGQILERNRSQYGD